MILDTGAARHIVNASFAARLRTNPAAQSSCGGRLQGDRDVEVCGMHRSISTTVIRYVQPLMLHFPGATCIPGKPFGDRVPVKFGELPDLADGLLIGLDTLSVWGLILERDSATGSTWIELRSLVIRLPLVESPGRT